MKARKFWVILVCLGMVLGGSTLYASKQPLPSKRVIRYVQADLQVLGYYHGKITGVLDKDTKAAVEAFQKKNGLKPDGIPGKKTRPLIYKAIKTLKAKKASKAKNQVKPVQKQGKKGK